MINRRYDHASRITHRVIKKIEIDSYAEIDMVAADLMRTHDCQIGDLAGIAAWRTALPASVRLSIPEYPPKQGTCNHGASV